MISCTRSRTQGIMSWGCFEGWQMCLLQQPQIQKTRVCRYARFYFYPRYRCPVLCRWYQVPCKCHSHSILLLCHNMYSYQAIFLLLDLVGNRWHNNNPFILHPIDNRIKKCAAGNLEFRDPLGPVFLGVVLQHKENYVFTRPGGTQQVTPEQNRYYHCELQCLKSRHPYFKPSLVQLPPELMLSDYQKNFLFQ